MPQTVHCNNTPATTTKLSIAQSDSLIGRALMQGQTSTLSSVHRPLLMLRSSAERSVSRHMSTFSTCGWCSSLWANCRFVILSFLAALFSPEIQRLKNHVGLCKKGRSISLSCPIIIHALWEPADSLSYWPITVCRPRVDIRYNMGFVVKAEDDCKSTEYDEALSISGQHSLYLV